VNLTLQESSWTVPYSFAWHKVWIDENGTVVPHDDVGLDNAETFEDGEMCHIASACCATHAPQQALMAMQHRIRYET
jgi:hypothetical protein